VDHRNIPKAPVIDIFIGRDGDAWRLYVAPRSWWPGFLWNRGDERGVFPVARPDVEDLDRCMWDNDSPFERRPTTDGGVEILAKGRSAITLLVWLERIVGTNPKSCRFSG
jgi:hypothetical protein